MKITTFTNQKGGVGKTTISTHTAHGLVKSGSRVAFLDACGQGNASMFLSPFTSKTSSLTVLSANKQIFGIDKIKINTVLKNVKTLKEQGFDYLIIDTAPSVSKLSIACLIISDNIFVPINISAFSLSGVSAFSLNGVKEVTSLMKMVREKYNSKVELSGLIPNHIIGLSKKQKISLGQLAKNQSGKLMPYLSNRAPFNDVMNGTTPIWNILPMTGNIQTASKEMIRLITAIQIKLEESENATA